jgi:hypothetical protein
MIDLTVERYGYLTMGADEFLDDISEVSEEWTNVFQAYAGMRAEASYADAYPNDRIVTDWAESLGKASGIYGEDGPVSITTSNMETFLESDIGMVFLRLERDVLVVRDDDVEEYETHSDTLIIVNGAGYSYLSPAWCEVRVFTGDDDSDVFRFASGGAAHTGEDCGADWILDEPHTLWPNGGGMTYRVEAYILGTFDEDGDEDTSEDVNLYCPECGGVLAPYAG